MSARGSGRRGELRRHNRLSSGGNLQELPVDHVGRFAVLAQLVGGSLSPDGEGFHHLNRGSWIHTLFKLRVSFSGFELKQLYFFRTSSFSPTSQQSECQGRILGGVAAKQLPWSRIGSLGTTTNGRGDQSDKTDRISMLRTTQTLQSQVSCLQMLLRKVYNTTYMTSGEYACPVISCR